MPLSSPLPHRLVEGAIGEVIPAELLQRAAAFGDSTVDMMLRGHRMDWRGYTQHRGLEFASAGACIVLPPWPGREGEDLLAVDLASAYAPWSFGFGDPPRLVREADDRPNINLTYFRHFLEWTMPTPASAYFTASAEYASTGALPEPPPFPIGPNSGRYRCYVGTITKSHGVDGKVTPDAAIAGMRRVFLWGHS